jgi:hypothetical protein
MRRPTIMRLPRAYEELHPALSTIHERDSRTISVTFTKLYVLKLNIY